MRGGQIFLSLNILDKNFIVYTLSISSLPIRVSSLWKWRRCNLWRHRTLSWNDLEH